MSRLRTPVGRNDARDELLHGATGKDFSWGDITIRIGDLPLFRRAESRLRQALRIVVHAPADLGRAGVHVRDAGRDIDHKAVEINAGPNRVLLFVPEVDAPRPVEVVISLEGREEFRAMVDIAPQRKWSIFLIHHSHLDIGYTDPQDLVLRHHLTYLDSALDLVDATDSWPEPAQFRWNVEANLPLQQWLRSRPARSTEAFLERVRTGRIEVAALPYTMHTEAFSIDELARQLWFTDDLRERFGIQIDTAMQTDVPGAALGFLRLLADAEVRYLSVAHNYAGRSVPYLVGGRALTRPFYWADGSGRRVCVWYTDTPRGVAYMEGNILGLAERFETASELVPEYLAALAHRAWPYRSPLFGWKPPSDEDGTGAPYPYDILHLRVQGAFADNASPSLIPAEIVRSWDEKWVYPQLRLATNREFFTTVEQRFGDSLDEFTGDWTDWWADGIGSAARPLGFNRRAQLGVRTAQTLNVLADRLGDDSPPDNDWSRTVSDVYDNMALFDEHTWGAANPWEDSLDKMNSGALQWERKAGFATAALEETQQLIESGLSRLSPLWSSAPSSLGGIVVINPSTWERTDLVTVFVPESKIRDSAIEVVDVATERLMDFVVEDQPHASHRPRGRLLSFVAHDVPALGFALFELRAARYAGDESGMEKGGSRIENEYYEVEFDASEGCITSILDRDEKRELVAPGAPFGFNQYIYDRYATAPHFNHLSSRIQADDLSLLGSRSVGAPAVLTERSTTPLWDRLTVRLDAEGARGLECTFTVLHDVKRVDIANRLDKIGTSEKESAFFAFPLSADSGSLEYEITGGSNSATAPRVPGSAHHMRAIRHWVAAQNGDGATVWATLEAPLVQFGNLHLPYAPFPATLDSEPGDTATIYSWVLNNIWDTNFPPDQAGEMTFCYALSSGDNSGSTALARQTAAGLTMPLLGVVVPPSSTPGLPSRGSFCRVNRDDVEVIALSRSRRGHDFVVMLQSHAAEPIDADVAFSFFHPTRAWKGTHLERHMEEILSEGNGIRVHLTPGELAILAVSGGLE